VHVLPCITIAGGSHVRKTICKT